LTPQLVEGIIAGGKGPVSLDGQGGSREHVYREKDDAMQHDEYLERRREFQAIRMDSIGAFDKAVLSLATGSLVLSMTFLEKIGKPYNAVTHILVLAAWISFLSAILCNLLSYWFARWNMDLKIRELDECYEKELRCGQEEKKPETVFWQNRATSRCNSGALITFFIGLLSFSIYTVSVQYGSYSTLRLNQAKEKTMSSGNPQNLNEGKTETPKAVSKPDRSTPITVKHGATETPQAVLRPAKPGTTETPQSVLRPAEGTSGQGPKSGTGKS
jgi:hypothetical protein